MYQAVAVVAKFHLCCVSKVISQESILCCSEREKKERERKNKKTETKKFVLSLPPNNTNAHMLTLFKPNQSLDQQPCHFHFVNSTTRGKQSTYPKLRKQKTLSSDTVCSCPVAPHRRTKNTEQF